MWWGVAAALLANALYSVGFVLQKRALGRLPELSAARPLRTVLTLAASPAWLAGSLALAAGFAAQLAVYRTLPIAAAQGIFVSGLVLLLLLSSAVLGERTSGRERHALPAVLAALVMVVASLRDGDGVGRSAPWPTVLLVCLPALAAGIWLYGRVDQRARRPHRMPTSGIGYGVAVGLLYGVSSLAVKGASSLPYGDGPVAVALALAASPYPYLLLCTAAAGLVMSQAALQRCRASLIVPVCTTVSCVFAAVLGTFAFGESLPAEPLPLALRLAGTALALGVLLTLPRHDVPAPAAPLRPHT